MKLQANPSTTIIDQVDESSGEVTQMVWIGRAPEYGPDPDNPGSLCITIPIRSEFKIIDLSSIELEQADYFVAITAANSFKLTSRPTMERDVIGSNSISSRIPLPIAVIEDLVAETPTTNAISLEALTDDDGFVATLMLVAGELIYLRYSNAWIPLTDPDVIDGLDVFSVDEAALDMYDQYDRVGRSIHVASLPVTNAGDMMRGEEKVAVVAATRELKNEVEEIVAEQVLPVLASGRELIAFIPMAEANPSIRWYVEKRAKALGVDSSELPWSAE